MTEEFRYAGLTPWRIGAVVVMIAATLFWMLFQCGVKAFEPPPEDEWD